MPEYRNIDSMTADEKKIIFSVAVISYFGSKYYYETIDSILRQDYPYIDLILSDDASDDFCKDEVEQYVEEHKGGNIISVQVFHQEKNLGTVAHAEFCRKRASGQLFYLMGAGDILEETGVFSRVVRESQKAPQDINVFCGIVLICDTELKARCVWTDVSDVRLIKSGDQKKIFSRLSNKTIIPTTGVFYRMSLLESYGGYDTSYKLIEDTPLYLKAARRNAGFQWVDDIVIARHRDGGVCYSGDNYSSPVFQRFTEDRIRIFQQEVFPYLDRIYPEDISLMLKLWHSSKERYIKSHSAKGLKRVPLRIRLLTLPTMLKKLSTVKKDDFGPKEKGLALRVTRQYFKYLFGRIGKRLGYGGRSHKRDNKGGKKLVSFKALLGRFLPSSSKSFHQRINQIEAKVDRLIQAGEKLASELSLMLTGQQQVLKTLGKAVERQDNEMLYLRGISEMITYQKRVIEQLAEQQNNQILYLRGISERQKEIQGSVRTSLSRIEEVEKKNQRDLTETVGISRETLWAQIYNNAVSNCAWLTQNDFAPGRWAIGYPLLYVLYSALDKMNPQQILELGSGQSTHMITQYAAANPQVCHHVIEQNEEWIQFFLKNKSVAPNTKIKLLAYKEDGVYKEEQAVRVYKGFREITENNKYDLIVVDAPSYNGKSLYNRVDILEILPECLSDTFAVILDDCNRPGEAKTANEITAILEDSGISFKEKAYKGEKTFRIWCSENVEFLCSL